MGLSDDELRFKFGCRFNQCRSLEKEKKKKAVAMTKANITFRSS